MDSTNGTFVNNDRIESRKYVELKRNDVINFAWSTRDYVLLLEDSEDGELDDDVKDDETK